MVEGERESDLYSETSFINEHDMTYALFGCVSPVRDFRPHPFLWEGKF